MKDIQDALARVGKSMAEVAQVVVKAMGDLTPEQRAVIEFLAENPEVAEAFQELNQKLARQRAIGGAIKEATQPKEPLLKDYSNEMEAIRAYGLSPLTFHRHTRKGYSTFNFCTDYICFSRLFENLKDGETYTIAELCGEEEDA